jgi:uncharacterized protein (TIGR03086 family)
MQRPELETAARRMATVLGAVDDAALARPTPCADYTVAALLDHIDTFVGAFVAAGTKTQDEAGGPPPPGDARHLRADWRDALNAQLDALVDAWRPDHAYEGRVQAGGLTMPAATVAVVAVEELVVHGWDLARAVDAPYDATPEEVAILEEFFGQFGPDQRGDAYGPERRAAADASEFDRAIARSGRDPSWSSGR